MTWESFAAHRTVEAEQIDASFFPYQNAVYGLHWVDAIAGARTTTEKVALLDHIAAMIRDYREREMRDFLANNPGAMPTAA